jgi:hypothetical protein
MINDVNPPYIGVGMKIRIKQNGLTEYYIALPNGNPLPCNGLNQTPGQNKRNEPQINGL